MKFLEKQSSEVKAFTNEFKRYYPKISEAQERNDDLVLDGFYVGRLLRDLGEAHSLLTQLSAKFSPKISNRAFLLLMGQVSEQINLAFEKGSHPGLLILDRYFGNYEFMLPEFLYPQHFFNGVFARIQRGERVHALKLWKKVQDSWEQAIKPRLEEENIRSLEPLLVHVLTPHYSELP